MLPKKIENWSLTSLQQRLVKTGGRLVKHARYYWLLLAEGHLTRRGVRGDSAEDLGAALTGGVRAVGLPGRKNGEEKKEGWWSCPRIAPKPAPRFRLTPAGGGTAHFSWVLVLSADPLAKKKLVALKAIAVHYRRLGSQNGDPGYSPDEEEN